MVYFQHYIIKLCLNTVHKYMSSCQKLKSQMSSSLQYWLKRACYQN